MTKATHRVKILLICAILASSFLMFQHAKADQGQASVYIIQLDGVPGFKVANISCVSDGAIDACTIDDEKMDKNLPLLHPEMDVDYPPYYGATPVIITNWWLYEQIIKYYTGAIVVNTHGECLPVPADYTCSGWVDEIAQAMMHRRLTWVHVSGYTFLRVWNQQTGDGGEWTEQVNGKTIGAGFERLMSNVGLNNIDLLAPGMDSVDSPPPAGQEMNTSTSFDVATTPIAGQTGVSGWWFWNEQDGCRTSITNYCTVQVGRPMKKNDISERLMMPIYDYDLSGTRYYPAVAISFAKAGESYDVNSYGAGTYLHIGAWNVSNGAHTFDSDFAKGFIGTAVAVYLESMGSSPSTAEKTDGLMVQNASLTVQPLISGWYWDSEDPGNYTVSVVFSVRGLGSSSVDNAYIAFDPVWFWTDPLTGIWSNVKMMLDPTYSREGQSGSTLSGLYSESGDNYGFLSDAFSWWTEQVITTAFPITRAIFTGMHGIKLLGEWLGQGQDSGSGQHGINSYDSSICFEYTPQYVSSINGGIGYTQFDTLLAVRLKVPTQMTVTGWQVLPLTFHFLAQPVSTPYGYSDPPGSLEVDSALNIAGYFGPPSQNDAGSGGDAADNRNSVSISTTWPGSYHGFLGGTDQADWYKFHLSSSSGTVSIQMSPPPYMTFNVTIYTPNNEHYGPSSNGPGLTYTFNHQKEIGYWYVGVEMVGHSSGVYSLTLSGGAGGGGCPFVYTWNGGSYVLDNNILPASENGNGTDTKDYYLLQQPLVPLVSTRQASLYSVRLGEFESEHDYIDQVKLTAVDHSPSTSIAVTQEGQIIAYGVPAAPLWCVDESGNSRLAEVSRKDGNVSDPATYFQGNKGDWLLMDFGKVTSGHADLILRDDMKCYECIDVQVPSVNGGWQTVDVLNPRDYWGMEAVNMTQHIPASSDFVVRLLWTQTHRVDYVGMDTSAQAQVQIHSASPILAIHSTLGDVTTKLLNNDENYAELIAGQQITLGFILPNKEQGFARDFILFADGYYYTIAP